MRRMPDIVMMIVDEADFFMMTVNKGVGRHCHDDWRFHYDDSVVEDVRLFHDDWR